MSQFKPLLLILFILFFVIYIRLTKDYFLYCNHAKQTGDYLVKEDMRDYYADLCRNTFVDYSNHSIMRYSLNVIYSVFITKHNSELEAKRLRKVITKTNYYSLKMELRALKFLHLIFYCLLLYILVIILPKYLIRILIAILEKIFLLIFLLLICEAFLNLYLDLGVDFLGIIHILTNYISIDILSYISWIIKKLFR